MKHCRTVACLLATVALVLGALATPGTAAPASRPRVDATTDPATGCFWFGPTARLDDPDDNYAFPDEQAHYYAAMFSVLEGATLTFHHEYAHARYQSLNSYNASTFAPTDALNDVSTVPNPGSRNPYLPGSVRAGSVRRSYTVNLVDTPPPTDPKLRSVNTLYAGVAGQSRVILAYRLYRPDLGQDQLGGVGLPRPVLRLADGTEVTGTALCQAVAAEQRTTLPLTYLPLSTYQALRNQPGMPIGFPAEPTPVWRTYYSSSWNLGCFFKRLCGGTPAKTGGQYSNKDNEYVSTYVSRAFGQVLVLRGRLPVTPRTTHGEPRMAARTDMRYWSICSNESYATTRAVACVYDEQVVADARGHYTIVLSLPADRPSNATRKNGVTWLSLSPQGDGMGNLDDTFLIVRNMLPSTEFTHAIQDTKVPGDEKTVMGDYLPVGTYMSKADFERGGSSVASR